MYKVVKKYNNICEKYKHQQTLTIIILIKGAFQLDRFKKKIGVTYFQNKQLRQNKKINKK